MIAKSNIFASLLSLSATGVIGDPLRDRTPAARACPRAAAQPPGGEAAHGTCFTSSGSAHNPGAPEGDDPSVVSTRSVSDLAPLRLTATAIGSSTLVRGSLRNFSAPPTSSTTRARPDGTSAAGTPARA